MITAYLADATRRGSYNRIYNMVAAWSTAIMKGQESAFLAEYMKGSNPLQTLLNHSSETRYLALAVYWLPDNSWLYPLVLAAAKKGEVNQELARLSVWSDASSIRNYRA